MTSQKNKNLQVYLEKQKTRLNSTDVPARHKSSMKEYKAWLTLDIARTAARLENDPVVEPKSK